MLTLLNSRRRGASINEEREFAAASSASDSSASNERYMQQGGKPVGPPGLSGMERPSSALGLHHEHSPSLHSDAFGAHGHGHGHGQLGPSLLERSPYPQLSSHSVDFVPSSQQQRQQGTGNSTHTPLIQYDHDDDDVIMMRGGAHYHSGSGRHTPGSELAFDQQQGQGQGQGGKYGHSGASWPQERSAFHPSDRERGEASYGSSYREREGSPIASIESLEQTFPPPSALATLGMSHNGTDRHPGHIRHSSHSSVGSSSGTHHGHHSHSNSMSLSHGHQFSSGTVSSSVSSRNSLNSFAIVSGPGSARYSGHGPLNLGGGMDSATGQQQQQQQQQQQGSNPPLLQTQSQGAASRAHGAGGYGGNGQQQQQQQEMSHGWAKEEFERAQPQQQQQSSQQQQQQQQQHPLLQSMHGSLLTNPQQPSHQLQHSGVATHNTLIYAHHQQRMGQGQGQGQGQSVPASAPPSTRASGTLQDAHSPLGPGSFDPAGAASSPMGLLGGAGGMQPPQQQQQQQGAAGGSGAPGGTPSVVGGVMDELKLKKYKTVMCQRMVRTGGCRYGALCDFAHDRHELRRNLDVHWYYALKCEKRHPCLDAECRYAHNDHEIMYHPRIYKTRMCANFTKIGGCNRKMYCSFAHGKYELRFHTQTNMMLGGPGNIFGYQPPQIISAPGVQQQGGGQGAGGQTQVISPATLPLQIGGRGGGNASGVVPATLTIAGGSQVLPRELVASLQASGINISAPAHEGARAATASGVSTPGGTGGGSQQQQQQLMAVTLPTFHKYAQPQQQQSQQQPPSLSRPHSLANSPRPSPSPHLPAAPQDVGSAAQGPQSDSFALHQQQQQGAAEASAGTGTTSTSATREDVRSPPFMGAADHLSPHFAQLGLGVDAHAGSRSSSAPHGAASSDSQAPPFSRTPSANTVATAAHLLLTPPESSFREQTDQLKIRILDLVDEVASMHYNRAVESVDLRAAQAAHAMQTSNMFKLLTSNLQGVNAHLATTQRALAIYAGEESALAAMSATALDALTAHLQSALSTVAQAKSRLALTVVVTPSTPASSASSSASSASPIGAATSAPASPSVSDASLCHPSEPMRAVAMPCAHKVLCAVCQPDTCPSCHAAVSRVVPLVTELPPLGPLLAPLPSVPAAAALSQRTSPALQPVNAARKGATDAAPQSLAAAGSPSAAVSSTPPFSPVSPPPSGATGTSDAHKAASLAGGH